MYSNQNNECFRVGNYKCVYRGIPWSTFVRLLFPFGSDNIQKGSKCWTTRTVRDLLDRTVKRYTHMLLAVASVSKTDVLTYFAELHRKCPTELHGV